MTHDETEKLQLSLQVEGVLRGLCAKNSLDGVGRYDGWLVIKRVCVWPWPQATIIVFVPVYA